MSKKPEKDTTNINTEIQDELTKFKLKLLKESLPEVSLTSEPPKTAIFGKYGPPVSPEVFIESTEYFGNSQTKMIRPWITDTMNEIFSGDFYSPKYQTVAIMAGKGSGKSYLSSLAACYMWYWFLSFNSFGEYLKLKNVQFDETMTVGIVGMAKSRDQVKKIFFDTAGKFINRTQAFRERLWLPDKKITSEYVYKEKDPITGKENARLAIIPGNSSATFAIGYNIWGAVIDEVEFFAEKNYDPVEDIYTELNNRRNSRFKDNGMIMMISSARVDGTFLTSFETKAEKDPENIYFKRISTYDCDPTYFSMPKFEFKTKYEKGDGTIIDITLHPPESFRPLYETDPYTALRDFDALPAVAGKPFYADFMLLASRPNKSRIDPCPDLGQDVPEGPNDIAKLLTEDKDFRGIPGVSYRIHADLSKGDMVKGQCGCGFAMCHKVVDAKLGFRIVLDLSVRFKAPQNKEIQIPEVLDLVKYLKKELKFGINMVTFDQWQSQMAIQTINGWNEGIFADVIAVDFKHHALLKSLIYSGQFDFFEDLNLLYEFKRLEDFGNTIDHAPGAYKDEADAAAGAAFSATMLEPGFEEPEEVPKPRVTMPVATNNRAMPQLPSRTGSNARYRNEQYQPRYRQI